MKLEIKHLVGYLPYSLQTTYKLSSVIRLRDGVRDEIRSKQLTAANLDFVHQFCTPHLIPLEKFKDINSPEMDALNLEYIDERDLLCLSKGLIEYSSISYRLAEICFANHIDIFNLIPQGLAVEKI